jgi:hypothetical protein
MNVGLYTCTCSAPCYIVICRPSGSTIFFFTLSHKRHEFQENVIEHKMWVLIFATTFVFLSQTFLILRRIKRDNVRNLHRCSRKVPVDSCQILIIVDFSGQAVKKSLNIKFHENPSSESRVLQCGRTDKQTQTETQTDGRTDRHDEASSRFRNFAKDPTISDYFSNVCFFNAVKRDSAFFQLSIKTFKS